MRRPALLLSAALLLAGCLGAGQVNPTPAPSVPTSRAPTQPLRYVPLGDSYTQGEGLARLADRWPNQLVRALRPAIPLRIADNLARNAVTTDEVIDVQLPDLETLDPDLVTLLVGVNDAIGDLSPDEYRANLRVILDGRPAGSGAPEVTGILDLVPPDRLVLITSPDYTLTPRGSSFGRPADRERIAAFNQVLREEGAARGVAVVDVSPISDLVPRDPTLVSNDGLYPSAKQYAGWVELIAPVVIRLLADP
jgi:lysophospholipase L1-like esterase